MTVESRLLLLISNFLRIFWDPVSCEKLSGVRQTLLLLHQVLIHRDSCIFSRILKSSILRFLGRCESEFIWFFIKFVFFVLSVRNKFSSFSQQLFNQYFFYLFLFSSLVLILFKNSFFLINIFLDSLNCLHKILLIDWMITNLELKFLTHLQFSWCWRDLEVFI